MASYLLLVHVGPVQDFIATARRCRDLWYGSHLLSEASRTVAAALNRAASTTLVFPGRIDADAGGTVSVANKIQCRVDGVDAAGLRELAELARTALDNWMDRLGDDVFDRVERSLGAQRNLFFRERAAQHIAGFFEFYWVGVPLQGDDDYAAARKRGDRLLAARKNTRDWEAAHEVAYQIPKSSLDGIRESVLHEDCFGRDAKLKPAMRRRAFGVQGEERLCGIGLIKRMGRPDGDDDEVPIFHSSSHMASAAARTAIARIPAAQAAWREFAAAADDTLTHARIRSPGGDSWRNLSPGGDASVDVPFVLPRAQDDTRRGLDGALLYGERLVALCEEADDPAPDCEALEKLRRKVLKVAGVTEPLPYYAMLLADGDRMGAAIDSLGESVAADAQAKHQALSEALDQGFASRCGAVVREHGGTLLYAGGDDVLALLPAGTVLQCSRALRDLFSQAMEGLFPASIVPPTLSVGLAFVHHLEPLSRVRAYAKQAEKAAKEGGRNALGVLLKKRGGGARLVVGSWNPPAGTKPLDQRLCAWAALLRDGTLASRLAGRLDDAIAPLRLAPPGHGAQSGDLEAVVRSLVRLTVSRRNARGGGKSPAPPTDFEDLYDSILQQVATEACTDAPLVAVDRMVDELRIAELVRDAWNEAFGHPETTTQARDEVSA